MLLGQTYPSPGPGRNLAATGLPSPIAALNICGDTTGSSACTPSSSTSVRDSSGNGHDGTWSGTSCGTSYNYSAASNGLPYAGCGNGTDTHISLANPSTLGRNSTVTLSIWVKPTGSYTTYRAMISKRDVGTGVNYETDLATSTGRFIYYDGSSIVSSTYVPPTGQWTHLLASVNGTVLNLYANGTNVLRNATVVAPVDTKGSYVFVGDVQPGSQDFVGTYNYAYIFPAAFTDAQALSLCRDQEGSLGVC